jgi:hypothetical protein
MSGERRHLDRSDRGRIVEEIARLLRERFNQNEREVLARELGVNPEDVKLRPETRDDFSYALIDYFERRGRLIDLRKAVESAAAQRRPFRADGGAQKRAKREPESAALRTASTRLSPHKTAFPFLRALLAGGALFACGAALYLPSTTINEPAKTPDTFVKLSTSFPSAMLPSKTSGTLVALKPRSSPEASRAHQELCNELKEVGGASVSCARLEDYGDDLLAKAQQIGASLAVAVEKDATAHIIPLGRLTGDKVLEGGIRPIDVSLGGVADRLSRVLYQLSVIAAPDFEPRDASCISLPEDLGAQGAQGVLDDISLLAIYTRQFAPSCIADVRERECGLLDRAASCNLRAPATALSCELAKHLLVERCPSSPAAGHTLETLTGPDIRDAYRKTAMLKLARHYCGKENTVEQRAAASRLVFELASREEPCVTAMLPEVATCLVLASKGGELQGSTNDELRRLAALPPASFDACGDTAAVARAIAGRAFQRALAGEWRAAADDFDAAYRVDHLADHLLNRAECLLHEGSTDAVKRASELLGYGESTLGSSAAPGESRIHLARVSIRRAVLSWIAANKRHSPREDLRALWEQVVHEFGTFHEGDVALPRDELLTALLGKLEGGGCISLQLSRPSLGSNDVRVKHLRSCISY